MTTTDINEEFFQLIHSAAFYRDKYITPEDLLDKARLLIERGLDFEWEDDRHGDTWGDTLLRTVLCCVEDEDIMRQIVTVLVDNGCNPLMGKQDDLRFILKHARQFFSELAAKFENQNKGWRDAEGGNFFHMMARQCSWSFFRGVEQLNQLNIETTDHQAKNHLLLGAMRIWIHQVRYDGRTPLHVLWSRETLDYEKIKNYGHLRPQSINQINRTNIHINTLLLKLGADLLREDHSGIRVIDLMSDRDLQAARLSEGQSNPYGKWLNEMLVEAQARILAQGTPVANRSMRGMPWL